MKALSALCWAVHGRRGWYNYSIRTWHGEEAFTGGRKSAAVKLECVKINITGTSGVIIMMQMFATVIETFLWMETLLTELNPSHSVLLAGALTSVRLQTLLRRHHWCLH